MDAGHHACVFTLRCQRHEARLGLCWRSLMAAEIFVTILTGFGLGHLLKYGRELSAMDQVIGVMVVIVVIGLIADKILFSPWERFLHRRWGTGLE
jgi:NitT/TauT family transport system permease protein